MADQKISELTALTGANAADDDVLAIVDTSAVETKKITRSELFKDTPSIGIGTSSPSSYNANIDDLVVYNAASGGITIATGATSQGAIAFADGTSASEEVMGRIRYSHDVNEMDFRVNNAEAMRIDSSSNVGIGFSNPDAYITDNNSLVVKGQLRVQGVTNTEAVPVIGVRDDNTGFYLPATNTLGITTNGSEAMRIDASGNLLVGKTSSNTGVAGTEIYSGSSAGVLALTYAGRPLYINRLSTDGGIIDFAKDGSPVGSIGVASGDQTYFTRVTGSQGIKFKNSGTVPCNSDGSDSDNDQDLGQLTIRWDDIYATNGTIQTSDRNEKQDIAELSDAEQRVAVAAKGLLRKFRWRDAVAEKGDEARTHFGIIAQDLQAAFAAEGLDAGDYAMFISSTWWEAERVIPAVEAVEAQDAVYEEVIIPAVLDEDGNEVEPERIEQTLVSEAVEAVEAVEEHTVTDTFNTLEEAPEGAVERTRMGVRYSELLAFIIAAI